MQIEHSIQKYNNYVSEKPHLILDPIEEKYIDLLKKNLQTDLNFLSVKNLASLVLYFNYHHDQIIKNKLLQFWEKKIHICISENDVIITQIISIKVHRPTLLNCITSEVKEHINEKRIAKKKSYEELDLKEDFFRYSIDDRLFYCFFIDKFYK